MPSQFQTLIEERLEGPSEEHQELRRQPSPVVTVDPAEAAGAQPRLWVNPLMSPEARGSLGGSRFGRDRKNLEVYFFRNVVVTAFLHSCICTPRCQTTCKSAIGHGPPRVSISPPPPSCSPPRCVTRRPAPKSMESPQFQRILSRRRALSRRRVIGYRVIVPYPALWCGPPLYF